jgi:hypothetical protein
MWLRIITLNTHLLTFFGTSPATRRSSVTFSASPATARSAQMYTDGALATAAAPRLHAGRPLANSTCTNGDCGDSLLFLWCRM